MNQSSFFKNSIFLIGVLIGYLAEYLFNVILARHLSPEAYGELSIVLRMAALCVPIFLLGFDNAIFRFLPPLLKNKDKKGLEKLLTWIFFRIFTHATWLFAIAFSGIFWIFVFDFKGLAHFHYPGILIILLLPIAALSVILNNMMMCFKNYYKAILIFDIFKFSVISLMLIIAFSKISHIGFYNIYEVILLGYFMVVFVQSLLIYPKIKNEFHFFKKVFINREWLKIAISYMISTLVFMLLCSIDLLMLKFIGHNENDIGYFQALLVICSFFYLVPKASSTIFSTKISYYYESKQLKKLQKLIDQTIFFDMFFCFLLCLVIAIFSNAILLSFGKNYVFLQQDLLFLMIGSFCIAITTNTAKLLKFTEFYNTVISINVGGVILAVILNLILIPSYGIKGAILTLVFIAVTTNLIKVVMAKKILKINPFIFI